MAVMFHPKTGTLVSLTNGNRTAQRNQPAQEFNNGVIFSSDSLKDNLLFEVRIDKKIPSWSGSIEIGVTTCDPSTLEIPASAADLREGSWLMSGNSVLKDGHSIIEEYGRDLDQLGEGDKVGVMRTSQGDLHFFVNGISQGIAASQTPPRLFATIDLYGKCAQVTVMEPSNESRLMANEINNESTVAYNLNSMSIANSSNLTADRLRFHERSGFLVKLSNYNRTAERQRPLDEFNNGVVMTHRPLRDNELFEIRIERLVEKWSGSIEVGITTHNPATLEFPPTMTNMKSGTIMMSGCGILTNGKGTRREYGEFNLDELSEGDRIGLMRKSNGNLHYYINSMDQGIAATRVPATVFGVVDLYGMTIKVTIIDEKNSQGLTNHHNNTLIRENHLMNAAQFCTEDIPEEIVERLLFHQRCGTYAAVIGNGRTAHRPNAIHHFNNAVVITNRPLKSNEFFEVRLDKMVIKWAGSVEIGVTTHSPLELEFPSTMTSVCTGTWMMTGNGVMQNGTTVIDEYGQNLDRLKVGDRVGVIRDEAGNLHFFVNGIDQGLAGTNVPERVYGVVDMYGQAAQVTLIDHSDLTGSGSSSSISPTTNDLRFHHLHGRNVRISNHGLSALRPNANGEFNDAIVISNRALRDGEMFEVSIDKMVDRWSGSIEAGVTAIKPEDLEFPSTMTDIDYDTWMLSGSAIMKDGVTVRNGYKCDLDMLSVGSRIGMMRRADGTLHYYVNGEDQEIAFNLIPPNVFAVIDLYGQCAQVTIVNPSNPLPPEPVCLPPAIVPCPVEGPDVLHWFSSCVGKNVNLRQNGIVAARIQNFSHGLVFSSYPLHQDELFEVCISHLARQWAGSLRIGLTTLPVCDSYSSSLLPSNAKALTDGDTWLIDGSQVWHNNVVVRDNYGPSLDRLDVGDRIGIKRCLDGTLHIIVNGEDVGAAVENVPKRVFAVVDLFGSAEVVTVTSRAMSAVHANNVGVENHVARHLSTHSLQSQDSLERDSELVHQDSLAQPEFQEICGQNIQLFNRNMSARRIASYNNGIVVLHKPLPRDHLFQMRIEKLNPCWTSSLQIGVTAQMPDRSVLPSVALNLKRSWIICSDSVFQNGVKVKGKYGPNLDSLQARHVVGVLVDTESRLHLFVNGIDQGIAAKDIPFPCYCVIDVYGQCEEISIVGGEESQNQTQPHDREKADIDHGLKEKVSRPPFLDPSLVKNCEYQNCCARFKFSLGLPDGYFNLDFSVCYCETCYKIRGDEAYYKKGDPPKDYAVPFGWCQFSLRLPAKAEVSGIVDKWHVAFHGTKPGVVRKILDCGELLLPEDAGLCPSAKNLQQKNKSKDGGSESSLIFFSPSIRYAASCPFTQKFEFLDLTTKNRFQAWVAFQVLVQPGAYNSGPQRIGAREPIDGHFSNSDIEWCTKERRATVLHSLLIRLENV